MQVLERETVRTLNPCEGGKWRDSKFWQVQAATAFASFARIPKHTGRYQAVQVQEVQSWKQWLSVIEPQAVPLYQYLNWNWTLGSQSTKTWCRSAAFAAHWHKSSTSWNASDGRIFSFFFEQHSTVPWAQPFFPVQKIKLKFSVTPKLTSTWWNEMEEDIRPLFETSFVALKKRQMKK